MKKVKLFEEFISEVSKQMISGTSGRTITTLDNRKYELKKDIKDAKIGDYINVVLPKGTIIHNLPGGVMANHKDLKDKYCTGYKSERWDDKFGVMVRSMPDTLEAIEDNSKVLESISLEETLNELHLSSAGVKDFLRAVYNSNASILQKLNFKNFRGLTDYVKNSDIEEFDELRDEAMAAGLILAESALNEAKKQKFVLYTNPNNSTDRGYVVIGAADVREILSDAKKYSDSYKILYQGMGTQADLVKAKQMFGDYRFGEESIDENTDESVITEAKDVKSEVITRLSQFFDVSASALSKFNFDGKDDIRSLTKALNGTDYEGVDNIVRVAVKAAKRDLGVDEAIKPAGLSKAETKKVAETYAKAISKNDGVKCTVNLKSLEEDSFDLDIDGEEYAGGSYMITLDGDVINAAISEKPVYGQIDSTVDQIIKNLKK
jgi:hypothetical protein